MKYVTIYSMNGYIVRKEFYTQTAQDLHTGYLWDYELMDKVDWIDYYKEE